MRCLFHIALHPPCIRSQACVVSQSEVMCLLGVLCRWASLPAFCSSAYLICCDLYSWNDAEDIVVLTVLFMLR